MRFTQLGCFIEEEGKVIAQGRREGRMFILETNNVGTAMFAKGKKVESNIDLWKKRFGHVNFPQLREMQMKNIVFGLPKFRNLRSLPDGKKAPTSIPQRALSQLKSAGFNPFGCVGFGIEHESQWKPLLRNLYR